MLIDEDSVAIRVAQHEPPGATARFLHANRDMNDGFAHKIETKIYPENEKPTTTVAMVGF